MLATSSASGCLPVGRLTGRGRDVTKGGMQDWVAVPICCRDGLKLKSKEDRESKTLEDMLCFTKVHVLCLSFFICKVVLQKPFYPLEHTLCPH